LAIKNGLANSNSFPIYIFGQENTGKTCLVATLLGDKFVQNTATHGADVEVCTVHASDWCRVRKEEVPAKILDRYHCKLHATALTTINSEIVFPEMAELSDSLPKLPESVEAELNRTKVAQPLDLESLPKQPKSDVVEAEIPKMAVLKDDKGIDTVIWDFAGQSVYSGLLSMFLKENGVAIVVFDASQDLLHPNKYRDSSQDPYTERSINPETTGCESLCYWLNTIHSVCQKDGSSLGAKSNFVPTVFLVATHIDKIGNKKAIKKKRQQIIDQLVGILSGHEFAQHLAGIGCGLREALEQFCFFISNKNRNFKELDRLKYQLIQASQYICNEQHPVIYLDIERVLLEQENPVITTNEFHMIATNSGFSAEIQSEEFKGALTYFHNKGTILHFSTTELRHLIVLSPQWLTKLISYVIVAHPYKVSACRQDEQYTRLQKHGILVEDFVDYMTQKFNVDQRHFGLSLTSEQVVGLIKHFKLVAQTNRHTRFLEENIQQPMNNGEVFIVPSMLPIKLPNSKIKLPSHKDKHACIVHFLFPGHFLPLMIFYQLLTCCIKRNIQRNEDLCL